ncbi:MAG: TlpA disulfide reductase family protein, partial [Candidatus Brocadiia bacterium]
MKKSALLALLFVFCATNCLAANPSYAGKNPPALNIGRFVGNPLAFRSLADYRGEVVVVEFFATWCPSCRAAMPRTAEISSKYVRPDLHVLTISREKHEIIERFFYHEALGVRVNYPVAVECDEQWGVVEIPQVYIVGRDGTVVWEGNPTDKFDLKLDAALAAPDPRLSEDLRKKCPFAFAALVGENYAKVMAEAAKADGTDEKKPIAAYFALRIGSRYQRYGSLADNWLGEGDGAMALEVLNKMLPKFAGTDYEQAIRSRIEKVTTDFKDSLAKWAELHTIASQARTARKEDIAIGFSKVVKFAKKAENDPNLLAAAKHLADIL